MQEPTRVTRQGVTVTSLFHDFVNKRSSVPVVWDTEPEKRLNLLVPYQCDLATVQAEAEKAVRALASEIAVIPVAMHESTTPSDGV
jgi:hypothetical protein